MEKKHGAVSIAVEEWSIPTYAFVEAEEMPMFAETAGHQGTTGNPYPARVTSHVDGEHCSEKSWTVVTLENDYIRLAVIPALGGRIFEAYDKTTGYDFLYRQHVIKPALIGAYGAWMSGGMEFNWPYHHRPSTMMPVDFCTETLADGSAVVWLSEHSPCDRTKGMVGIVLRPECSYFETRVSVTNRTPHRQNFLWWENAAVAVHEDYKLVFPPDVTWVHHHYDRSHTTFPLAAGQYGADNITEPKDISRHGNSKLATSYFAAPSKYDFFGGYDFRRGCGVLHIADHHLSPGKKMFTWGYGRNAENWEAKLTDADGAYAELMAGSYTDDQPDFTWLAPYETKNFSQFWYPTAGIGSTSYATLDAAVAIDREAGAVRVNVTAKQPHCRLTVCGEDGRMLLDDTCALDPSRVWQLPLAAPAGEKLSVRIFAGDVLLLAYDEEEHDSIHIPADNPGIPLPDRLHTPCELVEAGRHIDQYRDPLYKPDLYYTEALRREPDYLPALKALGEYYTRCLRYEEALQLLDRAWAVECRYNQNPEDGSVNYLRGLCLCGLGKQQQAYDAFSRACWSANVIPCAAAKLAELDGCRGDWAAMYHHAMLACEKEHRHPTAWVYAALALWKAADGCPRHTYHGAFHAMPVGAEAVRRAAALCREALALDALNRLAGFALTLITGKGKTAFYGSLHADAAQTALDIGFDLLNAGFVQECAVLLRGVLPCAQDKAMLQYTLAHCCRLLGEEGAARRQAAAAKKHRIVTFFPLRAGEAAVLESALQADENDGFAAYLLGCLRYHFRSYQTAAALWKRAVRCLPDFYIPYRNLALAYFNHLGRAAEALPLLRRAVELHSGDATLLGETETVMRKLGASGEENAHFLEKYKPSQSTDQMQLTLARTYNAAGRFDRAEELMRTHVFSPGEGAELATAEPYIYACFARGRIAMKQGRYEEALALFCAAQTMPDNLNVGFWNESVMIPYRYYEAAALRALGRHEEADALIRQLAGLKNVGMWNMGGEFVYYYAMAVRLGGDEMRAQSIMRKAIPEWEQELAEGCIYHKNGGSLYNCFVGDGCASRKAALYTMLAYGDLFNGNTGAAKEKLRRALAFDPDPKAAFELSLLEN